MGRKAALARLDPASLRFAQSLREELGAERVILHGTYAMGFPSWDSDYDLIIVARGFGSLSPFERYQGIHELSYAAGGHAPLSLTCVTPEEFSKRWPRGVPSKLDLPEALDLLPAQDSAAPAVEQNPPPVVTPPASRS